MEKTKKQGHRIVLSDEEFKIIQHLREEEERKTKQLKKEKEREDYIVNQQFFKDAIILDEETKKVFKINKRIAELSHVDLHINKRSAQPYDVFILDEQDALGRTISNFTSPISGAHRVLSGPRDVYRLTLGGACIELNVVKDRVIGIAFIVPYCNDGYSTLTCNEFDQYYTFCNGAQGMKLHQNPLLNIIYCYSCSRLYDIEKRCEEAHNSYLNAMSARKRLENHYTEPKVLYIK